MAPFDPSQFHDEVLHSNGIDAFFGVPDSSLSGLLSYLSATKPAPRHLVMASEGGAVGLAAGYYLASRKIAMCYLQNSGYSNALNPLQSLAVKEVFGIPMLLMIGWRGKPGIKDEPQHALIGPRLLDNLKANDIPHKEIPDTIEGARNVVKDLLAIAIESSTPVALIVPPGSFAAYEDKMASLSLGGTVRSYIKAERWLASAGDLPLSREAVIRSVDKYIGDGDISISSLGGNSRELYMVRKQEDRRIASNFFCLGAMGHAFSVANGVRLGVSNKSSAGRVFCIDGDGSFLMHVGNNAVLADVGMPRLVPIIILNGVHSSTGNQPLTITKDAYLSLAEGLNYGKKLFVDSQEGLDKALSGLADETTLIVVFANELVPSKLPRPSETARELRDSFMESFV